MPQFEIGLHHGVLNDRDRSLVEELFSNNKIQVLVCTSTLAWGINLPSHLVIIKGTEYYGGKKKYVAYVITDMLQMMGRAGQPQYDQHGKAVILVHEPKKSFYKKVACYFVYITNSLMLIHLQFNSHCCNCFISWYETFPVESNLGEHLHFHLPNFCMHSDASMAKTSSNSKKDKQQRGAHGWCEEMATPRQSEFRGKKTHQLAK